MLRVGDRVLFEDRVLNPFRMPLTAGTSGVTVTDGADAGCARRRFVGVITTPKKGNSHVER